MDHLRLSLLLELCLAFGVAGLFWPERFIAVFDVLMFPWAATYRVVRAHSVAAIAAALFLLLALLAGKA
jgi:hypothetical protein